MLNDGYQNGVYQFGIGEWNNAEGYFSSFLRENKGNKNYRYEILDSMYYLAQIYVKKGHQDINNYPKAAGIFNYCYQFSKNFGVVYDNEIDFKKEANQVELEFLRKIDRSDAKQGQFNPDNWKDKLNNFRKNILDSLKSSTEEVDKSLKTKEIKKVYSEIFNFFFGQGDENLGQENTHQSFFLRLIDDCHRQLGQKDYKHTLIGFGSLSLGTITPWSDLEFGILIENPTEACREYFRSLINLLHIKIINLGETPLHHLGITSLNDFSSENQQGNWFRDEITGSGFSLDKIGPYACKTPLGRPVQHRVEDNLGNLLCKFPYELIKTPIEMMDFQNDPSWWTSDNHLVQALRYPIKIYGDDDLFQQYRKHLKERKESKEKQTDLCRFLELMKEDINKFQLKLGIEEEGKLIHLKQGLYRFGDRTITALSEILSILNSEPFSHNIWEMIDELGSEKYNIFPNTIQEDIKFAISLVNELRLKTYGHFDAQKEMLSTYPYYAPSLQQEFDVYKHLYFIDNTGSLNEFYCVMLSFQSCLSNKTLTVDTLQEMFDKEDNFFGQPKPLIQAMIYTRFTEYSKAYDCLNGLDKDSHDISSLFMLSWLCYRLYKSEDFVKYSEQLKKLMGLTHPETPKLDVNLLTAYYQQGKYIKAKQHAKEILTCNFDNEVIVSDTYDTLGLIYQDLGQYGLAEECYKNSIKKLAQQHFLTTVNQRYINAMRNDDHNAGEVLWGGDIELGILAELYNLTITVHRHEQQGRISIGDGVIYIHLHLSSDHYEYFEEEPQYVNGLLDYAHSSKKIIPGDGNCLFNAVKQSAKLNEKSVRQIRDETCDVLQKRHTENKINDEDAILNRFRMVFEANSAEQRQLALENLPPCSLRDEAQSLSLSVISKPDKMALILNDCDQNTASKFDHLGSIYHLKAKKIMKDHVNRVFETFDGDKIKICASVFFYLSKAIELHKYALKAREKIYPDRNHVDIADSYTNLGYDLLFKYQICGADKENQESVINRIIAYPKDALGISEAINHLPSHPDVANKLNNLGRFYIDFYFIVNNMGFLEKAKSYLDRAKNMQTEFKKEGCKLEPSIDFNRGIISYLEKDYQKAVASFETALDNMDSQHEDYIAVKQGIGAAYLRCGTEDGYQLMGKTYLGDAGLTSDEIQGLLTSTEWQSFNEGSILFGSFNLNLKSVLIEKTEDMMIRNFRCHYVEKEGNDNNDIISAIINDFDRQHHRLKASEIVYDTIDNTADVIKINSKILGYYFLINFVEDNAYEKEKYFKEAIQYCTTLNDLGSYKLFIDLLPFFCNAFEEGWIQDFHKQYENLVSIKSTLVNKESSVVINDTLKSSLLKHHKKMYKSSEDIQNMLVHDLTIINEDINSGINIWDNYSRLISRIQDHRIDDYLEQSKQAFEVIRFFDDGDEQWMNGYKLLEAIKVKLCSVKALISAIDNGSMMIKLCDKSESSNMSSIYDSLPIFRNTYKNYLHDYKAVFESMIKLIISAPNNEVVEDITGKIYDYLDENETLLQEASVAQDDEIAANELFEFWCSKIEDCYAVREEKNQEKVDVANLVESYLEELYDEGCNDALVQLNQEIFPVPEQSETFNFDQLEPETLDSLDFFIPESQDHQNPITDSF